MSSLKVFNPEHDLALANGSRHFIAPNNIREMARDLAPLLEVMEAPHPIVWGWDNAITERLHHQGLTDKELPTDTALAALRSASERKTAHHLLETFRATHPEGSYEGESRIIRHMDEAADYAAQHAHILLKNPLSSSGKGLRHMNREGAQGKIAEWGNALISRHGYLTAEPYYTKAQDFAMEFYVADGQCRFIGYSLFTTNQHGRYEGNILMDDAKIETHLAQYVPRTVLHEVQSWIVAHSDRIIPQEWDTAQFPLYFGIDMMIVKDDSTNDVYAMHPCVEINLRLNMGIIAHEAYRNLLAPHSKGRFMVTSFATTEALHAFHREHSQSYPAVYREGRVVSGYHPLTPILADTRHHAYILCE